MTLTDDEIVGIVNALAMQAPTTIPEWDRAIARHFYALGLAAIPREPTPEMFKAAHAAFAIWAAGSDEPGPVILWRAMWDVAQGGNDERRPQQEQQDASSETSASEGSPPTQTEIVTHLEGRPAREQGAGASSAATRLPDKGSAAASGIATRLKRSDDPTPSLIAAPVGDDVACEDCGAPYGKDGWCDVNVPDEIWNQLGADMLCFRCMTKRIQARGIESVPVIVASGPYTDANETWRMEGWYDGYKVGMEQRAAPVGDDALVRLLRARDIAASKWGGDELAGTAAARIEALSRENSQLVEHITVLERELASVHDLNPGRYRCAWPNCKAALEIEHAAALRQLAAAQACIVAADAMRARTARVPEHWAAYDAARAALGAGDG